MPKSVEIFFCYAREDEVLRQGLEKQLRALRRQGVVDVWHDRQIEAGAEWERVIDQHLNAAQVILLLVSPDFMDSDYCYGIEMKHAMERHERGETRVIPIILRHVYWQKAPFGKLQALPTDGEPVVSRKWYSQDEAFFDVAEGIRIAVESITKKDPKQIQDLIKEGKTLHDKGRYNDALLAFNQVLLLEENNEEALKYRGGSYHMLGQQKEALADLNRSLELTPNDVYALNVRGDVYRRLNQYNEALADFNRSLELDARNTFALKFRGEVYRMLSQHNEALADLNRSLELQPDDAIALYSRGDVYRMLNRYDEALADLNRSLELQPDSAPTLSGRGEVYRILNRYDEALADLNRSLELQPEEAFALKVRGDMHRLLKHYNEALADLNRSLKLAPNDAFAIWSREKAMKRDSS